jgi:hypothetical protein
MLVKYDLATRYRPLHTFSILGVIDIGGARSGYIISTHKKYKK